MNRRDVAKLPNACRTEDEAPQCVPVYKPIFNNERKCLLQNGQNKEDGTTGVVPNIDKFAAGSYHEDTKQEAEWTFVIPKSPGSNLWIEKVSTWIRDTAKYEQVDEIDDKLTENDIEPNSEEESEIGDEAALQNKKK